MLRSVWRITPLRLFLLPAVGNSCLRAPFSQDLLPDPIIGITVTACRRPSPLMALGERTMPRKYSCNKSNARLNQRQPITPVARTIFQLGQSGSAGGLA